MIIVADSGSTKCDWLILDQNGNRIKTNTMGFNPFFHSSELIYEKLSENPELITSKSDITHVYFYGAGCSSAQRNAIIEQGLQRFFTSAVEIQVDHDLVGAALSTTKGEAGIACIIGTGSNSCFFDGSKVHEAVPALGYILGDEGSGSYFGKILLSNFLYNRLPEDIHEKLRDTYGLNKEGIFENTYNKPNANVYLASFMRFVSDHREHPFFRDMIYRGLSTFVNIHVWCFDNFREVPVHFVGSVAYYFREVLEEVASNHRFKIGNIEKRPVEPLSDYHLEKIQTLI
jgi:N-acetylglucosamine kinase-like BadF-type ATPase